MTTEHLPSIPYYLKCQTSFAFYRDIWETTKQKLVFINPTPSKNDKKGKPDQKSEKKPQENGDAKEKSALLEEEKNQEKKKTKADAEESDLPNEGTLCSQRSIVSVMFKCYWRPVLVGAAFKVLCWLELIC